jgi:hypothetical protein
LNRKIKPACCKKCLYDSSSDFCRKTGIDREDILEDLHNNGCEHFKLKADMDKGIKIKKRLLDNGKIIITLDYKGEK